MQDKKILFIFSGATNRQRVMQEIARGENADTALRGMNHIVGAQYLDVEATVRGILPAWLYRLLPWHARSLVLYPRVLPFDVVIAQDDLLLGYLISLSSRFLRKKTQWFYIAINSSILIRRHTTHSFRLFLLKTFWKSFAGIICLSHEQIEDFARIGVPRECLFFVPFGVDVDFYASVGDSDEEEFVVSVGRDLGRDYGTLLEAAKESDHPFVIVAAHKNLPGDMPLPPNVTVRHNLPLAEVRDLYARARVVVIASKDAEVSEGTDCSGQTVILDALAAGRPVVATERPWIKEYFTPSEELLVVPPHNPRALAAAIELLWQDRGEREHLAHAGRAKVRVAYTTKTLAMALERVVFTEKRDSTDEDGRVV